MNESHRGMVKHILSSMTAKMILGLTGAHKDADAEARSAYVESMALAEITELIKNYELRVVKEAMRQWEIELEALDFLIRLHATFIWKPIRYLGILYAMMRYGRDHVMNAIKLGETITRN